MKTKYKFICKLICAFFAIHLFLINVCFANILSDWKDSRAYRPHPILFLHGFASGSPQSWTEAKVDTILNQYYSKYYTGYNSDPTILSSTRFPYLEIINFGSNLIDRNSSIDTYKIGDRYVLSGQRRAGDPGWSDKLNTTIEALRQYYRTIGGSPQRVILVAHSMGGLAARKYLKSYSYADQKVEKLIMIGTPNLGSILAEGITVSYTRNRRWGWFMSPSEWASSSTISVIDKILESTNFIDMNGDAVWDMDPTSNGSGFIKNLNNDYSVLVDHFAIAGKHWLALNLGDTVVSLDSQLGTGVLSLKNKREINVIHWIEPAKSIAGDNPLFKFLDSTKPELKITSPDPTRTTEIYENSIHITGEVYKEYLPADSKLTITIRRQEDGYQLPPLKSYLKASDLWIPNNPDSPVAEFDEVVNFSGAGTYKISCQVKNPAGLTSVIKDVWVKVIVLQGTYVIIHCHNPEGKEIASIQGMDIPCVEIYEGFELIGWGAYDATTHNRPQAMPPGTHRITAEFNGISISKNLTLQNGEIKTLIFEFPRTEVTGLIPPSISSVQSASGTYTCDDGSIENIINLFDDGITHSYLDLYRINRCSITYSSNANVQVGGWFLHYHNNMNISGWAWSAWSRFWAIMRLSYAFNHLCGILPPPAGFWYWYTQGIYTHPNATLPIYSAVSYSHLIAPPNFGNGYGIDKIYPRPQYPNYNTPITFEMQSYHDVILTASLDPSNLNFSEDFDNTLTNWHITSVPYDLLGNAI